MFDGIQSALNPRGVEAAATAEIAWVLFLGGTAIFLAVIGLAAYALLAPRERAARLSPRALIIGGGIVFPAVTLGLLLVYSLVRAAALHAPAGDAALRIEVVGHQWWWRVHYLDAAGRRDFATANEIRIPVGQPVELRLASADVIHSFWVPTLAGKLDMIPGRTNVLRLEAKHAGDYRGQCAEYCGGPHAFMAFFVVAEPPERYREWAQAQREAAGAPAAAAARGAALFALHCAACHTVRGSSAAGTLGPDLTHVGSRRTLGAGLLPNNAGTLAAWIASNQQLKPGNLMPEFRMLPGEDLAALAAYLQGLR